MVTNSNIRGMKLSQYIETFPRQERRQLRVEIAKKLGISEIYLRHMTSGRKKIQEKYAVAIEKATDGKVRRQDVCPHLYE